MDTVQALLESATSPEARLAATLVLVGLAFVAAFVLIPLVVQRGVRFVGRQVRESEAGSYLATLDDVVGIPFPMRAVIRTLQATILVGIGLALLVVWGHLGIALLIVSALTTVFPYFLRVVLTVVLLVGAIVGTRFLEQRLDEWLADANYVTAHQEGVVFRVLQVCIFIAAGLAALSLWNVDLGGLLIGAGFLGIVFGMAARQTLGSLVAGFVLMFSRPFEIGDWVEVDDYEGIILDITIINTRLKSFDGETIVLPNDRVASSTVINRTKRRRLRLRVDVGVDYSADLEHAETVALEAIEAIEGVSPAPKPQVIPTAFDDSAITLECRFWISPPNARTKWRTKRAVIHAVKEAFDREGIDIPYPQRALSSRSESGGMQGVTPMKDDESGTEVTFSSEE